MFTDFYYNPYLVAQIWWLSILTLFDFEITYRTWKSNQAANALSHHAKSNNDNSSETVNEEYEAILSTIDNLKNSIKGINMPTEVKQEIHIRAYTTSKRQLLAKNGS